MKKYKLLITSWLLLTVISFLILNAQEKQKIFLIKKIIDYSTTDSTGKNEYTYNEDGNELTHLIQIMNNGNFENLKFNKTEYNSVGDKISELIQKWIGSEWVNNSKTDYDYNEPGVIDTAFHYSWVNGDWVLNSVTVYKYNNRKLCISQETRQLIKNFLWGFKLEIWQYDTYDRIIFHSEATYDLDRLEYQYDSGESYKYDKNGNLIESTKLSSNWNGRELDVTLKNTFLYDDKNNLIQHLNYSFFAGEMILFYKKTFTYDSINKLKTLTKESRKSEEDPTLYKDILETYEYENDTIKIITSYKWNNQDWIGYKRFVVSYNENMNEILKSTEVYENGNWFEKYRCYKTYDIDKNITSVRNQILDTQGWINYNTRISVQDSKGRNFEYLKYAIELDWSFINVDPPIGILEDNFIDNVIFPNPAKDILYLSLNTFSSQNCILRIYNIIGEECLKIENPEMINGNTLEIPLYDLKTGVYFLSIHTKDRTRKMKKMVTKFSVIR